MATCFSEPLTWAELALLTFAYWVADVALRQGGIGRLASRLGADRTDTPRFLWLLACAAVAPYWHWNDGTGGPALRVLGTALTLMLTWKATTRDIDIVLGDGHGRLRIALLVAAAGAWVSPAFVLAAGWLLTSPFGLWEHHATLPMRVVQALVAQQVLMVIFAATPLFGDASTSLFFLVTMLVSHYLITALAKALLGPHWYSWVLDNRLHHMAASAYSWGWARFVPWPRWRRVIGAVAKVERPLQLMAFGIELLSPLALLDPTLAIALCLGWAGFHLGVFSLSGLLFWDWVVTDLVMAWVIWAMPPSLAERVFGPASVLVAVLFMVAFPLRHKLFKPMPLGWFDTPFTQRVHWQVRGASGRRYGLYNDFMCPHERLYGKVHAAFMAPVAVLTYHLGEVWKPELRDAIRQAGPDLDKLQAVRDRFGIMPRNRAMQDHHERYLRAFFAALAGRARKTYLPRWLRFLKAPGDQLFYWGELPAYRGQEPAVAVTLHYREEYFDGQELQRLRDTQVLDLSLDDNAAVEPVVELTPKQMDDYLLGMAKGRLIDLPGFRADYVDGDDGRPSHAQ